MPSLRRFLLTGSLAIALAACLSPLFAQAPIAPPDQADLAPPGHVQYVDGSATIERDGQLEPVAINMPVIPGDRLHTSSGRVEILFADASALDVDQDSTVDLLSPTLLRLTLGRMMLTIAGAADPSRAVRYQVDTPTAAVQTDGPGEFRIATLRSDETELAVLRGYAVLTNERGSLDVRAGERSVAFDGTAPSRAQLFNSARFDPFDRWVAERRDDRLVASSSSRYLPRDLQVYGGVLDRSGSWQYDASYGNVWYPNVDADWRPYYDGYWSSVPSYGWTWIGADLWSWPTHHYGRWGHVRGSWFWIPGRAFAPAWVSWATAADYVSWCPLGFDNRPVFSFSIGLGSWRGWTVLPRTSFGFREHRVNRYAIAGDRLPRSAAFVTHSAPPPGLSRSGRRSDGAGDPRSANGRRDDRLGIGRPAGSRAGIPSAADSSRRRDVGDPPGRANTGIATEDPARRSRGGSADFRGDPAAGRNFGVGRTERGSDGVNPRGSGGAQSTDAARPRYAPGTGVANTDGSRRRDGVDPGRVRAYGGSPQSNDDAFARRRSEQNATQPYAAPQNPQVPNRPDVRDLTARPDGSGRSYRQPVPDSERRSPEVWGRRPTLRVDEPRSDTAFPRYRPPVTSAPDRTPDVSGRRPEPASPQAPPPVIYHRGPEQPPPSPGVVRRLPESSPPPQAPNYRRGPESASPPQAPSYRRGPENAPPPQAPSYRREPENAPPPRSAPASPPAADHGGGRDRGGERAVPRREGSDGGGGSSRRR